MHRIQVQLTVRQEKALREMARLRGSSISAPIRDGINHILEPSARERAVELERARKVIGAFDSGFADVGERHDAYLADAYRTSEGAD